MKKPDVTVMGRALRGLGQKVPLKGGISAHVEALKTYFQKTVTDSSGAPLPYEDDGWVVCHQCANYADLSLPFCPFCGDEGDEAEALTQVERDAVTDALVLYDGAAQRIKALELSVAMSGWDIGAELLKVHSAEAWKARGLRSFTQFLERETRISRPHAYRLMEMASKFTRKDFQRIGVKGLALIARLPAEEQEAALEIGKAPPPATSPSDARLSVVAKVSPDPMVIPFSIHSPTGDEVTLKAFEEGAHAHLELSADVHLYARPKFRKGTLVGLELAFKRVSG